MTFDFVLDAFPDYTKFDPTKKVLAVLQVVESDSDAEAGEDLARRLHCRGDETTGTVRSDDNTEFDHFKGYGYNEDGTNVIEYPYGPDNRFEGKDDDVFEKLTYQVGTTAAVEIAKNANGEFESKTISVNGFEVDTEIKVVGTFNNANGTYPKTTKSASAIIELGDREVPVVITDNAGNSYTFTFKSV